MRFLHIISAVTLLGLSIAGYFYFLLTYLKNAAIRHYVLMLTTILDALILIPLILFVFLTGFTLNIPANILVHLPWILSSSFYLLLTLFCLVMTLSMKIQALSNGKRSHFQFNGFFYVAGFLQIIFLLAITHDMVVRKSWLISLFG